MIFFSNIVFCFRPNDCIIQVDNFGHQCKIIFDDISNATVQSLLIRGTFDVIPELSDAVIKFENLEILNLGNIKLKIVHRSGLIGFNKIVELELSFNEISELEADTFDDLKKLEKLDLGTNKLKELHPDVFKELHNLRLLKLTVNQLETLPGGIFRNNKQIHYLDLSFNKLKKLHPDLFKELPPISYLDLAGNVCIDDSSVWPS